MQKKRLLSLILVIAICLGLFPSVALAAPGDKPIYEDTSYSFEERAADLVARMSLSQKGSQLVSQGSSAIPASQLGGGALNVAATKGVNTYTWWSEALHGYSHGDHSNSQITNSTSYPQNMTSASTWNPDLYYDQAVQIGNECRERTVEAADGADLNLTFYSPTVNMQRDPRWGRNEETFSEDVYLQSIMGTRFVQGMEGKDKNGKPLDEDGYYKTVTTVKHYTANNSENNRLNGGATTDLRALREYYTAPYRNIIQNADVSSLMTAYSTLNGEPTSMSSYLMDTLLRQTWGFSGYITSDCDSVATIARHNYTNPHTGNTLTTIEQFSQALAHGEDLECNGGHGSGASSYNSNMSSMINAAVDTDMGTFTENTVDVAVHRLMTARMKLGEFDGQIAYAKEADDRTAAQLGAGGEATWQTSERLAIAEQVATEGVVMLKNDGMLPLQIKDDTEIVVVGAWQTDMYLGLYSAGQNIQKNLINIQKGIENAVKAVNENAKLTYITSNTLSSANEDTIKNADYVIVVVGTPQSYSREDSDRGSIALPSGLDQLISQVGKLNKNTVAVMETCGSMQVDTFESDVNAILWSSYQGIRKVGFGNVITGAANPSGKTTSTWYKTNADIPNIYDYNMYATDTTNGRTYMYYKGETSYPFGYGLSYTTFEYSNLSIDKTEYDANDTITATFTVKNTGNVDGMEVAQLYVAQPEANASLNRPIRRLEGFEKVSLKPGESKTVTVKVAIPDLAYYNETKDCYEVDTGKYQIQVGTSSAAANLKKDLTVSGAMKVVPAVLTAKPNQGGDNDKGIEQRLIFDKGQTVDPQLTVAMNDESLYGYIITDQKSPIKSLSSRDFPEGTTVSYTSNRPGVVTVEGDTIKTVGVGVATVTATLTYNGVSVETDFVVYVESTPYLENITINGKKIDGFQSEIYNYSVIVDSNAIPDVKAVNSNPDLEVVITKPEKLPGVVTVQSTNKDTGESVTYNIGVGTVPTSADFKTKPAGWRELNGNANAVFGENGLTITTEQGAFGTETAPKNVYMQSAMGDWVAQTKVTAAPVASNQQAGMIVYNSDRDYVRFVYEYPTSGSATVIRAYRATDGAERQLASANLSAAAVTLQVVKQGGSYELRYTTDGVAWKTLTTVSASYACPQIGVLATNGTAADAAAMTANFDGMAIHPLSTLYPRAKSITVNGTVLTGFAPETFVYNELATGSEKPVIEAAVEAGLTASYVIPDGAIGTAKVIVSSAVASTTYTINFGSAPQDDYFADGDFNEANWTILNEANTEREYYRVDKGVGLVMPTQPNDIYTNGSGWKNCFVTPAMGNWEVITKVFYPQVPTGNYQQAMMLVWQDDNNYIRMNCQTSSLTIEPLVERNGSVSGMTNAKASAAKDGTVTLYFKVRKDNNDYTLSWSQDGKSFNQIGVARNVILNNPQIGLFVSQNSSVTPVELAYEYVAVTSVGGVNDSEGAYLQEALVHVADYVMDDLGTAVDKTARTLTFSKVPHDYTVSFTSGNEAVISSDGTIIHDENTDQTAELTVVVKDNNTGASETRTVTLTVPAHKLVKDIQADIAPGIYTDTQTVTLTTGTADAVIRYTTDGSDPATSDTAVVYAGPITVDDTMTIKAVGVKEGYDNSNLATFEYKIYESKLNAPTSSLRSGTILTEETSVELTAEEGAQIRYTTDGSTPTASSPLYTGPITVSKSMTLKAIAVQSRHEPSDVVAFSYFVTTSTNVDDAGQVPVNPDELLLKNEYEDYFRMGTFGTWNAGPWADNGNVSSPANALKLDSQLSSNTRTVYNEEVARIEADETMTEEEKAAALQAAEENIIISPGSAGVNELRAIQEWNEAHPDSQRKVRGHVLSWHGPQQPDWFFTKGFVSELNDETRVDPETMLKRLDNYIRQMMEYYSQFNDVIIAWDVTNEALDDYTGQIRNSEGYQVGEWGTVFRRPDLDDVIWDGTDYPEIEDEESFFTDIGDQRLYEESRWVRQAFASARKWSDEYGCDWKLYFNDFQDSNKLYEPKMSQTIKMLSWINDDDIDGYGMQGRLAYAYPTIEMIDEQIHRALTETGCEEVSFTEADIRSDFIPNPYYDPDKETRLVTEDDVQWPLNSGSWANRNSDNGNTFNTHNSPAMRNPEWGVGNNNAMATNPEIMKKQADYIADLMQVLLKYAEEGQFPVYQWDGTNDTGTFNGTTGCTMWDYNGNPKYSFYAAAGAPTLYELKKLLDSAPADSTEAKYSVATWTEYQSAKEMAQAVVGTRIYDEDAVNTAKAAKAILKQAIDGLQEVVPGSVSFLTRGNAKNFAILNQSSSQIVEGKGLLLTNTRGTILSDANMDGAANLNNPQDLVVTDAKGDWTATVKLRDVASGSWWYGYFNFLAMQDYDNHIGFLVGDGSIDIKWEKGGVQTGIVVDSSGNINNTPYFRITKSGDDYTFYTSTNCKDWKEIAAVADTGLNDVKLALDSYGCKSYTQSKNVYVEYIHIMDAENTQTTADFALENISKYLSAQIPSLVVFPSGSKTVQLPKFNGYTVSYVSDNVDIVSPEGVVTAPTDTTKLGVCIQVSDGTSEYLSAPISLTVSGMAFKVTSVAFTPDSLSKITGDMAATVVLENTSNAEQSGMMIVALYDPDGAMVNYGSVGKAVTSGATEKFEARFRVPFAEGDYAGYVAKVFVWDGDSLTTTKGIPLSDVTILDQ